MNKYIRQIEKEASFSVAGGVHLLQNALTNSAIKSKSFAKSISENVAAGYHGQAKPKLDFVKNVISGSISPEIGMMKDQAYQMGQHIKTSLPNLSKRDMVGIRMLTQGRFNDLKRYGLHKSPAVKSIAENIEKTHGIPAGGLLQIAGTYKKNSSQLAEVEKTWKSEKNPLLSNILSNVTRHGSNGLDKAKSLGNKVNTALFSGAGITSLVDPITGAVNAAKSALNISTLRKNKYTGKIISFAGEHMYGDPAKEGFKKGLEGKKVNPIAIAAKKHLVNPISGHLQGTANELGLALHKGNDELPVA